MKIEFDKKRLILWWYREDGMIFPLLKINKTIGIYKNDFEKIINKIKIEINEIQ